ncbi:hypothetical protein ALC57_11766 [Trachymyrmex cornetzi]|uniref:DNA-directed DNA polymerase n=1 Tax=Trachymyrmex cornetzi TaxID=471704 RepID=A0A151J219_9HYME|nr:hypothetical protein ALC57_11766 [Trachymyrmex cornetzi]
MLKREVINVQSTDNACFAWSVVATLYPAQKYVERESYPHYSSVLNLQDIQFPMTLSQIKKFEALNDISINVYAIEKGIVPIRLTDRKRSKHVNLLYVEDDSVGHFALIKDLSRLVSSQIKRYGHRKYFCDRKERVPFVVYADLECALEKIDKDPTSATYTYQHHNVFSVGYYVHYSYDSSLSGYRFRRDKDYFTRDDWEKFNSASHCHVCEKPFAKDDTRVRDHCHLTGRYRGLAHSNCNLNYKDSRCIPVVFHNLSSYDAHFIIKEIATAYEGHVDLLPITKEYISFTKQVDSTKIDQKNCMQLRFIVFIYIFVSSLDKLASFLNNDILRREFSNLSEENFNLLTRKGVFLYEYIDCSEKLNELRLLSRESFYSSLTDSTVSESDCAHAVNVWRRFSMQTLGEYSNLYQKTDVLLLADVFENFRDSCIASYGLDPAYYYTLSGFTWDAMLKPTGVKFELLTDIDMVMFVEHGIRGGLSQCSNRYARANNKYMSSYDPSKPSSYLIYYDVSNLYGWAMCQSLPYADFQWVDDVHNFDFTTIVLDSPTGYILEVDLEFPQHLHDAHTDLPFCPTREKPPGKRDDKLLATLCDNIELNTKFRTLAKNDFEKNLYKLMNNTVFGKTMENVRDRVDVKLLTKWEGRYGAEAMIAKPNFHSRSILSENLVAIELRKFEVKFDKPIYVGMCILGISKTCLYEFHHEYMAPLFREKCKIMYTDTDSLIYHVECDDIYDVMKRDINRFDTSDYAVDNAYSIQLANKKGLNRKCNCTRKYALRVQGKKDAKKAKGVKSSVVAKSITFEDYTCCLNNAIEMTRRQSCIGSKLHEVYTISETKIAISPHNDKRYIVSGSTDTLPWGHYRCK